MRTKPESSSSTETGERSGSPTPHIDSSHTELILAHVEAAEADLISHGAAFGAKLGLAAFPTAIRVLLPGTIRQLAARDENITVRVIEREPEDALSMLRVNDADLAIAHEYDRVPRRIASGIEAIKLLDEPMLLALADHHPKARAGVALADLADDPTWILPPAPGATCREEVIRTCADAGFAPIISSETYSYDATLSLVATGAVALVPSSATDLAPKNVQFFSPSDVAAPRYIFAAVRAGSRHRPDIVAAIEALTATATNIAGYRPTPSSCHRREMATDLG